MAQSNKLRLAKPDNEISAQRIPWCVKLLWPDHSDGEVLVALHDGKLQFQLWNFGTPYEFASFMCARTESVVGTSVLLRPWWRGFFVEAAMSTIQLSRGG